MHACRFRACRPCRICTARASRAGASRPVLTGAFAALALILGVVGMYGVVSYGVVQRRREFGIRLALGARATQVTGVVVREALALAGIAVGRRARGSVRVDARAGWAPLRGVAPRPRHVCGGRAPRCRRRYGSRVGSSSPGHSHRPGDDHPRRVTGLALSGLAIAANVPGAYAIAVRTREAEIDDIAHAQRADARVRRVDELALVVMHARRERPCAGLAPRYHELALAAAASPGYPVPRLKREGRPEFGPSPDSPARPRSDRSRWPQRAFLFSRSAAGPRWAPRAVPRPR